LQFSNFASFVLAIVHRSFVHRSSLIQTAALTAFQAFVPSVPSVRKRQTANGKRPLRRRCEVAPSTLFGVARALGGWYYGTTMPRSKKTNNNNNNVGLVARAKMVVATAEVLRRVDFKSVVFGACSVRYPGSCCRGQTALWTTSTKNHHHWLC